jgi:hypothetical protein
MGEPAPRRGSKILSMISFGYFGGETCNDNSVAKNCKKESPSNYDDTAYGSSARSSRTVTGRNGVTKYKRGTVASSSSSSTYQPSLMAASANANITGNGSIRFPSIGTSLRQQTYIGGESDTNPRYGQPPRRTPPGSYGSSRISDQRHLVPAQEPRRPQLEKSLSHGTGSSRYGSQASSITSSNSQRTAVSEKVSSSSAVVCDKCDGKHETELCPYFKKKRDDHPDAQKNFYKKLGGSSSLPGSKLRQAREVRQPGDGSCLFHSMAYGLRSCNASSLRAEICNFIAKNGSFKICDTPLSSWVKWDSGASPSEYARKMSRGSWGGGIEMAVCSEMKGCNVHVYERSGSGYKRISAFDYHTNPEIKPIVRVVYQGGVHYDALVANV